MDEEAGIAVNMTQDELRTKFHTDFPYYAAKLLRIRIKEPEPGQPTIPLVLNKAQEIFLEMVLEQWRTTGRVRIAVLKGRQMGLSTVIGALLYWFVSLTAGVRGMTLAHKSDGTKALFGMVKRYHDNVPGFMKPKTKYSSQRELTFPGLDSSLTVGTAGSDGLGRGETLQFVHASEVAFFPPSKSDAIWSGLMDAVPQTDNSWVFAESTAFGNSGTFYDLYRKAQQGHNDFLAVFLPWTIMPGYAHTPPVGFARTFGEDEYVKAYVERWSGEKWYEPMTDAQLYWRRMRIGEKGEQLFAQEYPLSDADAFQSSGMQAFLPEHVERLKQARKHALSVKMFMGNRWEEMKGGTLTIYNDIEPGGEYVIGADVGYGISTSRKNADYSVACVLDSNKRQVAVMRSRVLPGDFARQLHALGTLYNEAEICVENAGPGYHTVQKLARDYLYPHVYIEEVFDKITEVYTEKLGFTTSAPSKSLIVNKLRDAVAIAAITVNCLVTLDEMRTYSIQDNGTYSADGAAHDDTIIALALALHIHKGKSRAVTDFELGDMESGITGQAERQIGDGVTVDSYSATDSFDSSDQW